MAGRSLLSGDASTGGAVTQRQAHEIGNADLPVAFTGDGHVVDHDFLVFVTRYQSYSGFSKTIPQKIFEETEGIMLNLRESGNLRSDFYFNDEGNVRKEDPMLENYYFAKVVTKGGWYKELGKVLLCTVFVAIDRYNNFIFLVSAKPAGMSPTAAGFYFALKICFASFEFLSVYYSWILTYDDMKAHPQTHQDDLAISDDKMAMYAVQILLYYFNINKEMKDLLTWTHPRGGTMGRAVAKVKQARIHILTWPSRLHYECDRVTGMQSLIPLVLIKNLTFMMLQIGLTSSDDTLVLFKTCILPKILVLLYHSYVAFKIYQGRKGLLFWLGKTWKRECPIENYKNRITNLEERLTQDGYPEETRSKLKALWILYQKHFRKSEMFENYPTFPFPNHPAEAWPQMFKKCCCYCIRDNLPCLVCLAAVLITWSAVLNGMWEEGKISWRNQRQM